MSTKLRFLNIIKLVIYSSYDSDDKTKYIDKMFQIVCNILPQYYMIKDQTIIIC